MPRAAVTRVPVSFAAPQRQLSCYLGKRTNQPESESNLPPELALKILCKLCWISLEGLITLMIGLRKQAEWLLFCKARNTFYFSHSPIFFQLSFVFIISLCLQCMTTVKSPLLVGSWRMCIAHILLPPPFLSLLFLLLQPLLVLSLCSLRMVLVPLSFTKALFFALFPDFHLTLFYLTSGFLVMGLTF